MIDTLVARLDHLADEEVRDTATELVQLVMELHRTGLERLLKIVTQQIATSEGAILRLAEDQLVAGLLLLHELHPVDLVTRVGRALEQVRPYLKSHGGNVELLEIDEGLVRLQLQGSCHGCPSSAMTLKMAIEEAISEHAPDVLGLEVEGVVPASLPGFIPLESFEHAADAASAMQWEEIAGLHDLADGEVDTRDLHDQSVLFLRLNTGLYAYQNGCSHCGNSLKTGTLSGSVLSCPDCGTQFDVMRAGRCLDLPALHLEPLPLLQSGGKTRIALAVSP